MLEDELRKLIDDMVETAVLRYETKVLPVLYELDRVNASIAHEMMRLRISEDVSERFNHAWDSLKRLIYDIEKRESNNGKETKDKLEKKRERC